MAQLTVFYILSVILITASLGVITARNPVHSALLLVLAFFTGAGIWMLLQAEFLAIALVLVYVGAVMVLFLFVVMMLDINLDKMREGFWDYLPLAAVVGCLMVVEMVLVVRSKNFSLSNLPIPADPAVGYSHTKELGRLLYTVYVYPFELASVVLLVAIVAAIALTLRKRKETKYIDPGEQVKVRRNDRLRILKMDAETKPSANSAASATADNTKS